MKLITKRKVHKLISGAILVAACFTGCLDRVYGASYGASGGELRKQYERQKEQVIESEKRKEDLHSQIEYIDALLAETALSIEESSKQVKELEAQIQLNEDTVVKLESEREDLKTHLYAYIRASYEHRIRMDLASILSHTRSLADFWNQSRYAADILEHFKEQLSEFKARNESVMLQKQALLRLTEQAEEKKELLLGEQEMFLSQVELLSERLEEAEKEEHEAKAAASSLAEQIAQMEAQERAHLEISGMAQADTWTEGVIEEGAGTSYYKVQPYPYQESDKVLLAGIIQAEAGGSSYPGMIAVGSVVMNRVENPRFPDTIAGVVYAPNQFEPAGSGRLAVILAQGPVAACMQAAQDVLDGKRNVHNLYFKADWYAREHGIAGVNIGGNVFH